MNAAFNYAMASPPSASSAAANVVLLNKTAFRSGKWTAEEEVYSTALIRAFSERCLPADDVEDGMSLRYYLSKKLGCHPKRISKKFEGTNYNGKQLYQEEESTTVKMMASQQVKARQMELQYLHERFEESVKALAASEKERRPSVQKTGETSTSAATPAGATRKSSKPAATSASARGSTTSGETPIAPAPATSGATPPPARLPGNSSSGSTSSSKIPFLVGAAGAGVSNNVADYLMRSTNTTHLLSGAGVGTTTTSILDGSGDSMMDRLSEIAAYEKYYRDQLDFLYAGRLQEAKAAAASLLNHHQQKQSSMPLLPMGSPRQGPIMTKANSSSRPTSSLLFSSAAASAAFPSYPPPTSPAAISTRLTSQDRMSELYAQLMQHEQQQLLRLLLPERQLKSTFPPRGTTMAPQEQQQSDEVGLLLETMKRRGLSASLPEGAASTMMNAFGNFYTFQENNFGNNSANTETNNTNKRARYF